MRIADMKPEDLPVELRVKIEHVMRERNLTWNAAVLSLAREVVSPFPTSRDPAPDSRFSGAGGWGPTQPLRKL